MAESQSITLRLLLLTAAVWLFSLNAQASVIPYWEDKSCAADAEPPCHGLFPGMLVDFTNPLLALVRVRS